MAECLRCGIEVHKPGTTCRDCIGVDPRLCTELREKAQRKLKKQREQDALLAGMVYVGTTAKVNQRKRDIGRKR